MPRGLVKTTEDEKLWERAKRIVYREYGPQYKIGKESFYALTTKIFKDMKRGHEKEGRGKRVNSRLSKRPRRKAKQK